MRNSSWRSSPAGAILLLGSCTLGTNLDHFSDGKRAPTDAGTEADVDGAVVPAVDAAVSDAADDIPGLMGRWTLDDSSGDVASDSSGNSHPGSLTNGPTWLPKTAGSFGALSFDGIDDYVDIFGSILYAKQRSPMSVTAWFILIDFDSRGVQDLIQIRTDSNCPWHLLFSNQPGYLGISLGSCDTWIPLKTAVVPALGAWHHVAVTYNGLDPGSIPNFQIMLDGIVQKDLALADGYGAQPQQTLIGAATDGNYWKGFLRDVRIYNRVLTGDEIATISRGN